MNMSAPTRHITIRPFELADLSHIVEVEHAVYGSAAYSRYVFRQLYDLFPSLLWVAIDDSTGKLAGHLCGAISEDHTLGWLLNAAVLAHYRRQGIGRRLVERGVAQLLTVGVRCVRTTTEVGNSAANRMYASLGFHEVRTAVNYYDDGVDRLIFEYYPPPRADQ